MGNQRQDFLNFFLNQGATVQVYPATVKSVSGSTCTVSLLSSELEIEDVRLVADPDAKDVILITPAVGSTVLIGCIENELSNTFVCQFSEVKSGSISIDKSEITFDKDATTVKNASSSVTVNQDRVTLSQGTTTVEVKGGKVDISSGGVSLKSIFDDLSDLIQNLKVVTSTGPSTALFADTIVSLAAFKVKYPKLLK